MNRINPLYDCTKSFEYNLEHGPFFDGIIPQRIIPPKHQWTKIFDYEVMSPIGLAACPIGAHARGISLASQLGFDVITHKTIRSEFWPAHAWPNLALIERNNENLFVPQSTRDERKRINFTEIQDSFDIKKSFKKFPFALRRSKGMNNESFMSSLAASNSIGNASMDLEWHCNEISKSRSVLLPGQLLMVSIFGTQTQGRTVQDDFAYIAQAAIESGAQVIELNFSCPNANHGILYRDIELSEKIVKEVVRVAGHIPVTVKVGPFDTSGISNEMPRTQDERMNWSKRIKERGIMKNFMHAIARAGARGIVGINTVPARVVDEQGNPYFGSSREISGMSGAPIFNHAKRWIESAAEINEQEKLGLTIFGMGGITLPEQFDIFLKFGADVALSATGAIWDPYLAHKVHNLKTSSVRPELAKDRNVRNPSLAQGER